MASMYDANERLYAERLFAIDEWADVPRNRLARRQRLRALVSGRKLQVRLWSSEIIGFGVDYRWVSK